MSVRKSWMNQVKWSSLTAEECDYFLAEIEKLEPLLRSLTKGLWDADKDFRHYQRVGPIGLAADSAQGFAGESDLEQIRILLLERKELLRTGRAKVVRV
jgi:hypothetical protein